MTRPILVICGLNREAAIAAGDGIASLAGGGNRAALEGRLSARDPAGYSAVVSFGLAGALSPDLAVGDLVVPTRATGEAGPLPVSAAMAETWRESLGMAGREAVLVGVDAPAMFRADKAALAARFGATAVDMESHVAGIWAARHGLPFAILRAISDDAAHDLPTLVTTAMRPDGSIDLRGVTGGLLRDPGQIAGLLRTARDAGRAMGALRRVRRLLGLRLGLDL